MIPSRVWRQTLRVHDAALAASTTTNYARAVDKFKQWAAAERIPRASWLPTPEPVACAYAASFAGFYSGGAARTALAALRFYHERRGWTWSSSARLLRIVKAVEFHAPSSATRPQRPPVTLAMLDEALLRLDLKRGFDLCVAAAMLVVFWGQMRLGEAVSTTRAYDSARMPAVKHVTFCAAAGGPNETTCIWLPATKTKKKGDRVWLARHFNDPSFALQHHFAGNRLNPNDPLFSYRQDKTGKLMVLTKSAFLGRLNEIWLAAGMQRVTGHCFRIGGTTALLRAGVPPDVVKVAGRWKSDFFLRYWRSVESIIADHVDLCDVLWAGASTPKASF